MPILDEALIDFALNLPHALKASGSLNKMVLRALAKRWLPPEKSKARKRGFGIPLDVLAAQSSRGAIKDMLLSHGARIHAFVDQAKVAHWVHLFEKGRQNNYVLKIIREGLYQRLFFLLSLEIWMQMYQLTW